MRAINEDDVIKMLSDGWRYGKYPSASTVRSLPTIEPKRSKGKWEKQRETNCSWSCSVCKEIVVAMPERMAYPLYDYCPYCGADMQTGGIT